MRNGEELEDETKKATEEQENRMENQARNERETRAPTDAGGRKIWKRGAAHPDSDFELMLLESS